MIAEKEIIEILDKKLKWKESIKAVEKEMKNVFTATEIYMLEEYKTQTKRTIKDIAKQIISKLPKLELFASGKVEDTSCEYSGGFHIGIKDLDNLMWIYDNKNIKIYVEVVDANTK